MPIYEYSCRKHGGYEVFNSMADCNNGRCPICGKEGNRRFSSFHTYMDFIPGFDHGLMADVQTKKQRETLIREKGLARYKD